MDGYEAAGGLYQPIKDVLVGSEDADQINTQIDKDLQTSGMILDEEQVQEAAKPVKIAKRLETNDTVSAVSAEEMYAVEDCAIGAVADRVTLIYRGEASPKPVKDGMESPCTWCDHPNACKHDSTIPGCKIVEIDHKRRIEITQL